MTSPANELFNTPLQPLKQEIYDVFWGQPIRDSGSEAFWIFYARQCEYALHEDGIHVQARTHEDIIEVVRLLKAGCKRSEIRDVLRPRFRETHNNKEELMDRSINLAANLLLMINFDDVPYSFSGRHQLLWHDGTLPACLQAHFSHPPALGHEGIKFQRVFHAMNLERFAGVQIVPTSNLLDHLRLTHDDTRVHVFHHVSFLRVQSKDSLLPEKLVEETIRTLALLFPSDDPVMKRHYRMMALESTCDDQLLHAGFLVTHDRQVEKFVYWHDRLVVLKQIFDEATPKTISQWWFDRRNGVQWYTFWIAIVVLTLTLSFGLIQSVEGALQVYGTFRGDKS
ncbi:hypothetical protein FB567DRAFT_89983 [Paraphoma chrysanthemicola]|uniref:Uncharacterized protein n=1 Tax=Paraphoma chrysanthemicola TaxID=798071 RepID=A0A8K0R1P7_9PLEO|nr:hypothetical protein FB567DRAFT_89983 [Paraphoma chrysanthemicola]